MSEEKIELILNTGSRYITNDEKALILDYIEYFRTKNNIVESKNIELVFEIERLNSIINELEKYLEEEKDRLAREISHIYENSLGKTRLVNEDIFNELILIQDKIMALKGDSRNE